MQKETATFGGGCFWCLEAIFQEVEGVVSVISGYAGGTCENPSYEAVCTGETGHAEVVQIVYESQKIRYETLLELFFAMHDPTTKNRQGHDEGTQYRSVIFYHSLEQKALAEAFIISHQTTLEKPIVTLLEPLEQFYPAESYHQNYFKNHPFAGYCQAVISPKVSHFWKRYHAFLTRKA